MNDAPDPGLRPSAVRLALIARQVRAQAGQALRADPIAVVGMACRLPGGADTPDRFWQLLCGGEDTIREVPPDRWNGDAWYDPDLATPAKAATKWGGFLDRIDGFDAGYFGIPPREADRMDPQQRLFLEVAIEALDNAGLPQRKLAGSRTGVFVASYHSDYAQLQYNDVEAIDLRTLTGTLHSTLANRLSWWLDLRGPSVSIDTACSASLVSVHLACQSLRLGESDIAITGGVSLMIAPELLVALSKVGFMAPDGRCKTFDALADGFGRGEGCSVIVLKRLSDAIADDDRILAVIRGSAVNQDGRSTVLAAPHGPAQRALILEALASAQLSPARIGFVETHGTGTALGDPIEVEALAATIGQPCAESGPCLIGSAKANLGHLEAAAGATGLIKAVLTLQHAAVPPQPNYRTLNPHIILEGTRLVVPRSLTPWPTNAAPRCAAVSSFGVGGTNAHVILEEAPRLPPPRTPAPVNASYLLPLSAKSPAALRALVESWIGFLADASAPVADLCHTAARRRTHYNVRMAVTGRSTGDLRDHLQESLEGGVASGLTRGTSSGAASPPRIGFVFSGQGPQWHAMGRELLAEESVFSTVVGECDALLLPFSGWSLLAELARPADQSRLHHTEYAQPALFALQVALAALWRSWGVSPDGVVGHSVGEIAALHVAGALSLQEAIRLVWLRGSIMQQATGLGRMASVDLAEAEARAMLAPFGDQLSIAAVNTPTSVVLSGEPDALDALLPLLLERGITHHRLPVQYAFHSQQMAPFRERLVAALGTVHSTAPRIPIYSTVTGTRADDLHFDAAYFGRNLHQPVLFAQAMDAMGRDGYDLFIELSPHPVLGHAAAACLATSRPGTTVLASLRRGRPERDTLLQACAGVYAAGGDPDWARVQPSTGSVATVPGYCWQHSRHWIRPQPSRSPAISGPTEQHPLLRRRIAAAGIDAQIFEVEPDAALDWLADHRVFGRLLLPAAAVAEILLTVAVRAMGSGSTASARPQLTSFAMQRPLVLPEPDMSPRQGEAQANWQVVAKPTPSGSSELALYEAVPVSDGTNPQWRPIATATAEPGPDDGEVAWPRADTANLAAIQPIYDRFAALGVAFGPTFRCLGEIKLGSGAAQAWATLPVTLQDAAARHTMHPVLIDAALQLCSVAAARAASEAPEAIFLPVGADRIALRPGQHERLRICVRIIEPVTGSTITADIQFQTPDGDVIGVIDRMRFARAEPSALSVPEQKTADLYSLGWVPAADLRAPSPVSPRGAWIVFADAAGTAASLVAEIEAAGGICHQVRAGHTYTQIADRSWMISPTDPNHYRRLLRDSGWCQAPVRGVIHCWSLDLETVKLATLTQDDAIGAGSVLLLVQGMAAEAADATCPVRLLTRGAQAVTGMEPLEALRPRSAGVWGLASVAALEHPELRIRLVDLDPSRDGGDPAEGRNLLTELLDRAEPRIALRGRKRWVPRLQCHRRADAQRADAVPDRPVRVTLVRPGSFDGLELRPQARPPLQSHEVRLRVLAAGINFRDILTVLQMYPGEPPPLGIECAGVITEVGHAVRTFREGDRVFGFAPESLATEVTVPAAFVAPVPNGMRAEDAAGIGVAFLTAWYGLHHLARLRRGERVLVHAAAGGVGLAAVQLAQRCGAEVFATAGSPAKCNLLRQMGISHVMDSRSVAFADQILTATDGRGVDVVLNSLSDNFIPAGIRALAHGGRFLELGKRGIWSPEEVAALRPDLHYHPYDLGALAQADHTTLSPIYEAILAALADGSLRPLPVTAFSLARVGEAMRHMAQARHIGKVVVRVAVDTHHNAESRTAVSAAATYWITGGLGALGLETARWLIRSGARHLVLTGRRPPTQVAKECIQEFTELGVSVRTFAADAADQDCMAAILDEITRVMPPLRGVVHAAGVVRDAVLINQHWDDARDVLRGKAHGAWLLHELTRGLPLDFFIMYSAAGVVLGAPGQGLYPAANAELDALAHLRRRLGLHALSVAWGAWSGAGMAADLAERGHEVWQARGLGKIDPQSGFRYLERLLAADATYAAVIPIDWQRFLEQLPPGADRAFFEGVVPIAAAPAAHPQGVEPAVMLGRLRAMSPAQCRQALIAQLSVHVRVLLALDRGASIDPHAALKELGLDSLMAVELRNVLVRSAGTSLPATLLFDYPTLDALARFLTRAWNLQRDDPPAGQKSRAISVAPQADTEQITGLSDSAAEAMLLQELAISETRRPA